MKKLFTTLVAMVLIVLTLSACDTSTEKMHSANVDDSKSVIATLEGAKEIELHKAVLPWGDSWTVKADGVEVANIKGQAFYLIGDTYSMYSKAGNFIGAEGEQLRLLNHKADIFDYDGKKTGSISQEIFSLLYKFKFIDANGKQVGQMDQKLSFGLAGDIKTPAGVKAWSFKKAILSWGSSVTVTRAADSDIPSLNAVWMAVIASEISDSSSSSSSNSKSK